MLAPTPPDRLVDRQGRPYFLWDVDMTLDAFRAELASPDRVVRAYMTGKLMRQAKPDDVFSFVTVEQILELWGDLEMHLGKSREFWRWILEGWRRRRLGPQ
jgi:hypothetical protein